MKILCPPDVCPVLLNSKCVFYQGDSLVYTGIQENENLESILVKLDTLLQESSGDFVPLARTITINGETFDLSQDREWTITAGEWGQISGDIEDQTDLIAIIPTLAPIQSITGTAVDNTDPANPIINFPGNPNGFIGQAFAIWTGTGLIFDVIWPNYWLDGIQYSGGSDQITLDPADINDNRFDAIIVDINGANYITGIASANPELPTIDPLTQILITYVSVPQNSTIPGDVTELMVYNENTESTTSSNNGTVDFEATGHPVLGTLNIDCGAFNNTHYLSFLFPSTYLLTNFSLFSFYVNLKAIFTNPTGFTIQLYLSGSPITAPVNITNGLYNFNRTLINAYQLIPIPSSAFVLSSGVEFDEIRIAFVGSNASGFRMDVVRFQAGASPASQLPNFFKYVIDDNGDIIEASQPNDTITIKGSEKTGAKELTIDSGGGHEIIDEDDTPLPQQPKLKFERLEVEDDIPNSQTIVKRPSDVFSGLTPPSDPIEGDKWKNTSNWKEYTYHDGYWVQDFQGAETTNYQQVAFSSVLKFDKNYKMVLDPQPGAVAFTLDATGAVVGNVNKAYIKSNGTNTPTYSADFVPQSVSWLNTINRWNVLYFEYSASGKVNYWVTYE
jgi:hypothetical protein